MATDTSSSTDHEPAPRHSWYQRPWFFLLIALAVNATCLGAVFLSSQSPPGPPDPPDTGPAAVPVGATATCPDGVAVVATVVAAPFPDLLPADEQAVTVTLRVANRSNMPVTDLTVSMTYDPALREDASPITLATTDPPMPWAPGGTGTQINEFEAKSNGLTRFDIHVSSSASSPCDLDFRDAGATASAN